MDSQRTLMLVEDEAIVALAQKQVLERGGYHVVHVNSGERAVQAIQQGSVAIDLILMDIDLGAGMDGTEAAEAILQLSDMPLVFLSAHTEKEFTERAEQITSYGYVVKNSGETVLFASIKMAFKLHEAHARLQASEQRFRLLAENARDLIYRVDLVPQRRFGYVSPAATALTGYTPEEHYADPDLGFKLVHPDDREALMELVNRGEAASGSLTLRWCRKDGRVIWTEQNNVPVYDGQGNLVAIEGIARDVTERKQLEETLRESNRRLTEFLRISKSVSEASGMGDLLQSVVDCAAEVTDLRSNAIYLLDGPDAIRLAATTPPVPDDFPEEYRVAQLGEHLHIKKAMESGDCVLVPDTSEAHFTPAEQGVVAQRNLRSILYVPIRLNETPMGVLILSSIGEVHTFSEEEIALLHGFADQAARLIEKTRGSAAT